MVSLPPCTLEYAAYYQVPVAIIQAVATQEGGRNGLIKKNKNGSYDLGIMQINSSWFAPGNPVDLRARGITPRRVVYDACVNVAVGTWILSQYYRRMGDWGKALAAYNAGPGNWKAGAGYLFYSTLEPRIVPRES